MQFACLSSLKMESSEPNVGDTLTIQNDQISHVKHVVAPLYVFFTVFGCWGGGGGAPKLSKVQPAYAVFLPQQLKNGNHLEERLLDQAQARASYTPLFWGHSRSIPQGMILDVQPLVKSLFCPIRPSPNGFFDFQASTP